MTNFSVGDEIQHPAMTDNGRSYRLSSKEHLYVRYISEHSVVWASHTSTGKFICETATTRLRFDEKGFELKPEFEVGQTWRRESIHGEGEVLLFRVLELDDQRAYGVQMGGGAKVGTDKSLDRLRCDDWTKL